MATGDPIWFGNHGAKEAYDWILTTETYAKQVQKSKVEELVLSPAGAIDHLPVSASMEVEQAIGQKRSIYKVDWDDPAAIANYTALWQAVPAVPAAFGHEVAAIMVGALVKWCSFLVATVMVRGSWRLGTEECDSEASTQRRR